MLMEYTMFGHVLLCLVNVAVVSCAVEGDVRLIDGISDSNQGRVEVYHGNAWGTVCGRGWSSQEAVVICRQLNLGDVLLWKAFFGNGSGAILVGSDCHDHDFHIMECDGRWEDEPKTCTHDEDVAVICYPEDHEDGVMPSRRAGVSQGLKSTRGDIIMMAKVGIIMMAKAGRIQSPAGLTFWYQMIIVMAIAIFLLLFLKIVKFIETSKVEDDEEGIDLQEIRTEDHSLAANQHVSISDECNIARSADDASKSRDDVTANKDDSISKKSDVTVAKSFHGAIASSSYLTSDISDCDDTSNTHTVGAADGKNIVKNEINEGLEDVKAIKSDVTINKGDVIVSENEDEPTARKHEDDITSDGNLGAGSQCDVTPDKGGVKVNKSVSNKNGDDTKESINAGHTTSHKDDVTENKNNVISDEHSAKLNGNDDVGISVDKRHGPGSKIGIIQYVDVSVQTKFSP